MTDRHRSGDGDDSFRLVSNVRELERMIITSRDVSHHEGVTRYECIQTEQSTFVVRLLYFVLVGWWLSLAWMAVAYILMLTTLGIPPGLMMANRVPYVFSLHRSYA